MISKEQFENELELIIANAIREDIGDGDHTSLSCIPQNATGKAKLLVKDEGIIAGVAFAKQVFAYVDKDLEVVTFIQDGEKVKYGDIVFLVHGRSQSILKAERLVLNARKTTPGIRAIEKWAVKIGGGVNHRFALYDMMMIKDNHIDFAGGISAAITKAKKYLIEKKMDLNIIVEARSLEEIQEILSNTGVHRILIDNFNYEDTLKAVALIGDTCFTESSGGINEKTIRKYADCGVDFISSGALTHAVSNLDLSLKAV